MIPKTREDAAVALKVCANAQGSRFDLTACAMACAIHEDPNRDASPALDMLAQITAVAKQAKPKSAENFAQLMFGDLGFSGCTQGYEDPCNADFIHILTSREGLPVGLGHVWRHAARVINAPLYGTDTPGHFVMRFETDAEPVFIDPFDGGAIMDSDGLNHIARRAGLDKLSDRMLAPISDRVMAVRLQTNLIARARARGDHDAWFRSAFRRSVLAPGNYQVALDFSQAAEAAGHLKTALEWSVLAAKLPGAPRGDEPQSIDQRTQSLHHKLN